jgi:hypothetical protein
MKRAIVVGAVAAWALAACLVTSTIPPPTTFPCPDGNCPSGFTCNPKGLCVPVTTSSGSSSSGSSTSGGSSSGGSSTGGTSSSSNGTSSSSSSGASSSTSTGTSSSSSGGQPPANFAGEWDMSFSHVSLTQDGGVVSGSYRYWGYTFKDPTNAGTISGRVQGNTFTGTFQDNHPPDPAVPLTWSLSQGQLTGTYQIAQSSYPWCGVLAGQGTPLPQGCGWSDYFYGSFNPVGGGGPVLLEQVADEVTGIWYVSMTGKPILLPTGTLFGVVSDFRVNGKYFNTGNADNPTPGMPGRFSLWMTQDETQFSGDYYIFGVFLPWCGSRSNTAANCDQGAGGGLYDGTWFTNLGTITLTQPQPSNIPGANPATSPVTGVWFGWGDETEYPFTAIVSGLPDAGSSTDFSLSWTDSSPLGGAAGLTSLAEDELGNTLTGQVVADGGGLWCGENFYAVNSPPEDGGQFGTLPRGCGMTDTWIMSLPNPLNQSQQLVQTRGMVTGTSGPPFYLDSLTGSVAFNLLRDAGVGSWTVVTGSWTDLPDAGSGSFTWYPDSQDQSFSGDLETAGIVDAGEWCGSVSGVLPKPCLQ